MMIHYRTDNLLESPAEALVNTVNTVGVMGKGIALQFKELFHENARLYQQACKDKSIGIGKLLVTRDHSLHGGEKIIINFPTKIHWRNPSQYSYIEAGLEDLVRVIEEYKIRSIAIPPLGAGNGGLNWEQVRSMMETRLASIDCEIFIYEPNRQVKEVLKKERAKLTPARAMLLKVLYDLVKNGEFASEFAAEKVAYFLQRFGAAAQLKLEFKPDFYGPYSGKVRHVLHFLNGSYITGYSDKDKKPFEELGVLMETEADVDAYLALPDHQSYRDIALRTQDFLTGYYSLFGLELLSTIDFIRTHYKASAQEEIITILESWSDRKKTLFSNAVFIEKAVTRLDKFLS